MNCQEVVFARGTCRVEVSEHASVFGTPVYEARMWVVESNGVQRAVVLDDGRPAEVHAGTEALALSSATTLLEARFGAPSEPAHACEDFGQQIIDGDPIVIEERLPGREDEAP